MIQSFAAQNGFIRSGAIRAYGYTRISIENHLSSTADD